MQKLLQNKNLIENLSIKELASLDNIVEGLALDKERSKYFYVSRKFIQEPD